MIGLCALGHLNKQAETGRNRISRQKQSVIMEREGGREGGGGSM